MSGGVAVHAWCAAELREELRVARTDATVATSAAHSSFSIMRAQKSALNSASTTSIFSTSMASGKPLRVPGDINILCVMSFIVSGGDAVEGRGRATRLSDGSNAVRETHRRQ